ncbi:glycerol transport system substrate-binding protein [Thalassospira sp. MBR-102]|jgi:glycerol transport system substrate-binding protein|uniref:ABC transporter substrate-binding protein n=1 Tax=Thalassospira TaxID=168934 RepID=UPI00082745D2|nr:MULTISPECIES: ABC transporter substrate-binding protein [Thalassospira]MBR9781454.1 carbohydrate ABC transporter substrate-binding protein [Rhodospirillales bacterium]MAB33345.1 ABC transporter substrate-binding protein [Thalassospira sp.]MAL28914.1 ABC transporter substrate-binding protein [Thalassospira sp.]MBA04938.1 ABC transporter substrate-binding protein [Thalassospira sp.]MBR9816432.1 carbohydrate ABC transporter substrate-binding protein [Rhodospirillales bacterium]|tara:strand:- start:3780 stop:5531 length:1752 start_codon:yes stop_codon:yes gene_type:complete|eukprot:TRINITY_DN1076_c0_g4_i1.p1 TRINITY_DN1076_c0_g4~~TRINITY_DN1076_c0_g4_i1.p1  ORF type:complete len:584 (+),score=188.88 TRINITY_DN1076_c0_g4_i1:510-2261(+)
MIVKAKGSSAILKGSAVAVALGLAVFANPAAADQYTDAAKKWIDSEFQPSSLDKDAQMAELEWFIKAAEPFRGMEINVVSETITTHEYESKVLAKAFSEITGIKLTHDLIGEGDVIEKLQTQMQSGRNIYDAYINDSDLIGTHSRYDAVVPLTDFMAGEGKDVTSPTLDLEDFIGLSFTTGPDGKLYQLPDQQFANLYWFRYDWFQREDLQKQFKDKYGYDLGVPVNWSAYEDIAEFFTNDVKEIDGKKVYGHMDYGKKDPSLGWRFTDAWLSMAGAGDKGIPNGLPVDEWGIRVEGCAPAGSSVTRGGAANGPAAVYALTKYIDWLKAYAPAEAAGMTFGEAGPVPAQGQIAQQIFWYTAFTADMAKKGTPVVNEDGTPKWRMAPSPHGPYWEEGMKLGYQDVGSWTLMKSTPPERRKAAWLYAQFVTAKTTSLKKTLTGLTPIRQSDLDTQAMTDIAPNWGGLVEFYRSPARVQWSPTGTNVPDYPKLAQLWWQNVAEAVTGERTPQEAMDNLATAMDRVLERLERAGIGGECAPKLNEEQDAQYWFDQPGAPKPKLDNEKPQGETVKYDDLIAEWSAAQK